MTVFCDNVDCCYIGEDGFCGCDKLIIVGGICAGSYRSGRNACDGDVDERLKAENAKLRELVKALDWCTENTDLRSRCDECPLKQSNTLEPECEVIMRELGMREEG